MKGFIATATLLVLIGQSMLYAQGSSMDEQDAAFINWYNKDPKTDGIAGVSVDRAYEKFIKDKQPQKTVIVAIIDSGVDIEHEDFEGKIWINEDEIPGNGIDDDNNGYVDDIHGWNFLGNKNGENVHYENLEETRIFAQGDEDHPSYDAAKEAFEQQLEEGSQFRDNISAFVEVYIEAKELIKNATGVDVKDVEDLEKITSEEEDVQFAKEFLMGRYQLGLTDEYVTAAVEYSVQNMDYYLQPGLNARQIIGDDPEDINDKDYGNPDVTGPDASHGTSVAGVVAAVRGNGVGIDGITNAVKIMTVRAVPQGDERDKDVALAIRYAVDNGAEVINMSFGKDFSPQKEFVDDAVRYAEEKGVLLVHASGNDGRNIDTSDNFPTNIYADGGRAGNWLEVGANAKDFDESLAASFSNYGKKQVDIFAPGASIVSLDLDNTYSPHDGTSLAAPVVTGVAALLLAYYPDATPEQLVAILKQSTKQVKKPKTVLQPSEEGDDVEVAFSELSSSGGILNAFDAFKAAKKQLR